MKTLKAGQLIRSAHDSETLWKVFVDDFSYRRLRRRNDDETLYIARRVINGEPIEISADSMPPDYIFVYQSFLDSGNFIIEDFSFQNDLEDLLNEG